MENSTVEDVLQFVEENDVKFIRLAFCDLMGNQKNISIMPEELPTAFKYGINFNSSLILGLDDIDYPDLYLKPDPDTLSVLPWRPQQGRVIRFYCDILTSDETPYKYDAKNLLNETLKQCRELGFTCKIGLKSEFYLFKTDDEGNPTKVPMDEGGYLDIAPLDKGENIRREICLCLEQMGIQPEASHHEMGPGQNEIDFKSSEAMLSADNLTTYRNVVGAIANSNGVFASFDPKPIKDECGNGLHLRLSIWKNGQNMYEIDPEFTKSFMAGVFFRMRDITLFLNSQKESYERFGKDEAPKYITWSDKHRSRLLRVPVVKGKYSCFELRSPDSSLNPYLAFGLIIQAGIAGIKAQEKLPLAVNKNSELSEKAELDKLDKLPESLDEAIACAQDSEFLQNGISKEIVNRFIEVIKQKN